MYKFSPSTSLQEKHFFHGVYMYCCTNVNPSLLKIFNQLDFGNNKHVYFQYFINKVIKLVDIGFKNSFIFLGYFVEPYFVHYD